MSKTLSISNNGSVTLIGQVGGEVVDLEVVDNDGESVTVDFYNLTNQAEWSDFVSFVNAFDPTADAAPRPSVKETLSVGITKPFPAGTDVAKVVQGYVDAQLAMVLDYTDLDGERTTRVVSPYEVANATSYDQFANPKFLRAWSHPDYEYRSFRIARINGIAPAAAEFIGSVSNPS